LEMKINGEPVAEIDIKASHLTIYHALVGEPLDGRSDPCARVGIAGIARLVLAPRLPERPNEPRNNTATLRRYPRI
jgi:hypothetical protein